MNKILKVFAVAILALVVFDCNNTYAQSVDKKGPSCTINISNRVKIGKTINGYISCYDDSELSDMTITANDFSNHSRLFGKIKITNVSNGYQNSSNARYYRWDFQVKGVFFGTINLQLKPGVISDIYGNRNYSSTTAVVKVGLI